MRTNYLVTRVIMVMAISCLLSTIDSISQVTIGAGLKPNAGALLDLKQNQTTDGSANSTKGLLLPRVQLEKPTSLAPIVDDTADKIAYAGITVFNLESQIETCHLMDRGLYIWDGQEWHNLTPPQGVDNTNWIMNPDGVTGTLTDYEGNTYTVRKFGNKWWTTQNALSTLALNGEPLYDPSDDQAVYGARINPAVYTDVADGAILAQCPQSLLEPGVIEYYQSSVNPGMSVTFNQSDSRLDFSEKFGLIYTNTTALDVCPKGWRLPNDNDWTDLLTLLDPNGTIASSTSNIAASSMRANGDYYKGIGGGPFAFKWNQNDDAGTILSGFDAYPAGLGLSDGYLTSGFGYDANWWSSTNSTSWYITVASKALQSRVEDRLYYKSVRCVMN